MVIYTRPEMSHPRQDMTHAHQTAPTQFVEANGIRFAYRRFGKSGGVPLVFNQHFTGTMDHWDPAVTDGLAKTREVILFNNAGVSSSSGEVPISCEQMGTNAVSFIRAIGLPKVDVLGFSIGGFDLFAVANRLSAEHAEARTAGNCALVIGSYVIVQDSSRDAFSIPTSNYLKNWSV